MWQFLKDSLYVISVAAFVLISALVFVGILTAVVRRQIDQALVEYFYFYKVKKKDALAEPGIEAEPVRYALIQSRSGVYTVIPVHSLVGMTESGAERAAQRANRAISQAELEPSEV